MSKCLQTIDNQHFNKNTEGVKMREFFLFSFMCTCFCACFETVSTNQTKTVKKIEVRKYQYESTSISVFFQKMLDNHLTDLDTFYKPEFERFCQDNGIDAANKTNVKNYATLNFLHALFTSTNASNGSKGKILDIPYFWHWVNPNPRSEIFLLENKQLLSTIKPSSEYDKYKSVAEIDRTPFLFLSDLFREKPKYGHPLCDTFSTFGWCS